MSSIVRQLAVLILYSLSALACSNKAKVNIQYKKNSKSSDQVEQEYLGGGLSPSSIERQSSAEIKSSTIENPLTSSNSPLAVEPTAVGGAYLICLEERTETEAHALCRFENENEERITCPDSWRLTFFSQRMEAKMMLPMDEILEAGALFSWKVDLTDSKLEELSLEIYDSKIAASMTLIPLLIDPATMRTSDASDPRRNKKPPTSPSALRGNTEVQGSKG